MKQRESTQKKVVYVVDGCRTPFLKAKGVGPFTAADLAVAAGQALLNRQPLSPVNLDEVILGCAMPSPDEANIARVVALRLGCGYQVPGFTVMRNCASGMQALDNAAIDIATGRSHLVLAGGTEAMSHAPILWGQKMTAWLAQWMTAKTFNKRISLLTQIRPAYFVPVIALLRGLTDPIVGLNMGQTAEELAYRFHLTRTQMDEFAVNSHRNSMHAYQQGHMTEVVPIIDQKGRLYERDDGIREDCTLEKLATLKPFFDKRYGMVTAANSSQVTDGACVLLLASREAVEQYHLKVIGRIVDSQWAALNPAQMGLGPVHAVAPILQRQKLAMADIQCMEINEAFAAQVLACLAAWDDADYCQQELGWNQVVGAPASEVLNRSGGAIALGHPIGASGARIVLHVLQELHQTQQSRGMAAICVGGGQGGAMYLERITEVDAV